LIFDYRFKISDMVRFPKSLEYILFISNKHIKNNMKRYITICICITAGLVLQAQDTNMVSSKTASSDKKFEVQKIENNAFSYGENLVYRIHYGPLNGGEAHFEVADKPVIVNNRNSYHVKVYGRSAGLVDVMFKVRDEYESFIDVEALLPWKTTKKIKEGNYSDSDFILYDHERGFATSKKGKINIEAMTQDIVSALYFARSTDMSNAKFGDVFPVNFYMDGKNYQLRFRYVGKETIKTESGTYRTLVVKPQLIEGRVFKDDEALTMWVTDDENKIPVRVESDLFVGSIKADLMEYKNLKNPMTSKVK